LISSSDQLAESVEDDPAENRLNIDGLGATGLNRELEGQKAVSSMF
jgi:hypothetical protein